VSSKILIRDHVVPVDRPHSSGGTDTGPMGGELFVAALAGCFTSNLLAIAEERDETLVDPRVEVTGEIVQGRFTRAAVTVHAGVQNEKQFARLVEDAEERCLVANTIRSSVSLTFEAVPAPNPG
jgi:organic hydroperoxide reductase OsmC/OhrA